MPFLNPTLKQTWVSHLADWRLSGLNGAAWCRERGITYCVFLYWKKRLQPKSDSQEQFVEITSQKEPNLVLECNGIVIRLSSAFDPELLTSCLQVIKRLPC